MNLYYEYAAKTSLINMALIDLPGYGERDILIVYYRKGRVLYGFTEGDTSLKRAGL